MRATGLKIFISSVQKEFAQKRRDLKAFLLGDAVLWRFVSEVFLFEEMPALQRVWSFAPSSSWPVMTRLSRSRSVSKRLLTMLTLIIPYTTHTHLSAYFSRTLREWSILIHFPLSIDYPFWGHLNYPLQCSRIL